MSTLSESGPYSPIEPKDVALTLALCPAIAVSDTAINAIGLGLAILVVTTFSSLFAWTVTRWLPESSRLTVQMLIAAAVVAALELLTRAWLSDLRESLAVFLPVLAVNMVLIMRSIPGSLHTLVNNVRLATILAALLAVLGILRELVGRGSLFHGAQNLFGPDAAAVEINLFDVDMGFLLAMLPPGAFIALGVLLALSNWIASRRTRA